MLEEIDKKRLFDNIYALIEEKKVKIGDLEENIGVSKGYLSRSRKAENDSLPSVDVLYKTAQYLGVSVDLLLHGDFSKATDNLTLMLKFVDKLTKMTNKNELHWDVIYAYQVDEALKHGDDSLPIIERKGEAQIEEEKKSNPLGVQLTHGGHLCESKLAYIDDGSIGVFRAYVEDDGFDVTLGNGDRLYIFKLFEDCPESDDKDGQGHIQYTVYRMSDEAVGGPFEEDTRLITTKSRIYSTAEYNELKPASEILYQAIKRHERDVAIDDSTRSFIDSFLNNE